MTVSSPPDASVAVVPSAAPNPAQRAVLDRLSAIGISADSSARRLAEYSYDASNYRVPPLAVVFPRSAEDVVAALAVCRETGTPLISRGGGTSMAGNAIGPGVVLDFSRHMNRIHGLDEGGGTVDVDPGVVLAVLSREVEKATGNRFTFAPDPSSKNRATVGGALGNDACGNHSVRYGRTSDHVVELDVVTSDGARLTATATGLRATHPEDSAAAARAMALTTSLKELAHNNLAGFRTELGRIQRQVSGYHLANLLPEKGFNVARALVGSEGTCVIVTGARMKLVPKPASALLVCLGYADVVDAARDIETILEFSPAAVEGIDEAIVDTMRFRRGEGAVLGLPEGKAWLYVDLDGDDPTEVKAQAGRLLARLRENGRLVEGRQVPDAVERASSGASARTAPGSRPGCPRAASRGPDGRIPPSRPKTWRTTSPISGNCWTATASRASCTGTSAPAACTSASPTICAPRKAGTSSGGSRATQPGWWSGTAARSPANTATAGPGPSCCP